MIFIQYTFILNGVFEIEKKLVKGAIYGFLIGLALAIVFIPDTITRIDANVTTIYSIPIRESYIDSTNEERVFDAKII